MSKGLLIDGINFNLWIPNLEIEEFHPIIKEHSKQIFGKETVFLDISPRLKSEAGLGSEPDGFVIDPADNKLYIVEAELSKHDPYKHINDQLTRFINCLDNLSTKNMVVEALFDEIEANRDLTNFFDEKVHENLHKWLSKLLSKAPTIVVVIEEKTSQVLEACKILMRSYDTRILEFQTWRREGAPSVHAHFFDSLILSATNKENESVGTSVSSVREYPEHRTNYDALLTWVDPDTKKLANELSTKIQELPQVNVVAHGRNLCFYKGIPKTKSVFAAYILNQKAVGVRIRTEPSKLRDPQNWTGEKVFNGWFFKTNQEKLFKITDNSQISYALELIKQSYDLVEVGA